MATEKKAGGIKKRLVALTGRQKLLILGFGVVLVIVIVRSRSSGSQTTQYQTSKVERGTLVSTLSASGTVVSANTFTIKTSASGVVSKVYVKDGDQVKKGQKIADIELDLDGEQQYAQANSSYISAANQLKSAQNSLRSAEATLNNVYDQIKGHDTDESFTIIETRTKAEVAKDNAYNSLQSAQATLTNADFNLKANSPTIIAPNSGIVQGLTIAEGLPLSAQTTTSGTRTGQRIASVIKTGSPLVSVNLSEIDVPKVEVGQKATVTFDSITDKTFTGVVTTIDRSGTTASNVTTYPAIIKLDSDSDQILPNMAATASIITDVLDNTLMVPTSALVQQGGQTGVRELINGSPVFVSVEQGKSSDSQTQILTGVNEGDEIITSVSQNAGSTQTRSVFGGTGGFGGRAVFGR